MHAFWWVFWIVVLVLVYLRPWEQKRTEDPLQLLKRRLAKGEISRKEYEEIKKTLLKDQ
ncbi:SHOCT domain-containing protein [Robiginitalea sp. SC105]|uniref:SHOCT domain-containing protein n=1 Tax=Robiginitalea sp. SC105 TaxID=2762332 RepID=UPI001C8E81FA|nr:SHOCT domain-containing protein [Robiginitalea sp. SC105]